MSALLLDEFVAHAYEPTAQTRCVRLMQTRRYRPLNIACDGYAIGIARATWHRPATAWQQRAARARRACEARAVLLHQFEEELQCAA